MTAEVQQVRDHAEQHVRYIVNAARAAPPGGNHEWDKVMAHYGAPARSPEERLMEAAEKQLPKGAVPSEVELTVRAMAAQATAELDRIEARQGQNADGRIVRSWLGGLADLTAMQYLQGLVQKSAVGAIFANAKAHVNDRWWEKMGASYKSVKVLVCRTCGAPQMEAADYACKYCGGHLMKKEQGV
jgi:hypothetical protein